MSREEELRDSILRLDEVIEECLTEMEELQPLPCWPSLDVRAVATHHAFAEAKWFLSEALDKRRELRLELQLLMAKDLEREARELLDSLPNDLSGASNEVLGKAAARLLELRKGVDNRELFSEIRHLRGLERENRDFLRSLATGLCLVEEDGVDLGPRREAIEDLILERKSEAARLRLRIDELEMLFGLPEDLLSTLKSISAEIARRSE